MKPNLPPSLQHLAKADPTMALIIDRIGPITLTAKRIPPFQALIHAVVHQQLSGTAAGTILRRFIALFPDATDFPTPEAVLAVEHATLRTAGLSNAKSRYVTDIATKAATGHIPSLDEMDTLSDDEIIDRLTAIKGVGRWTAEMLLLFNLGRPDILPIHDLGIQRGYQIAYRKRKLPTPVQLAKHGKRWAPYRTTAARYLWSVTDTLATADW